MIRCLDCKTLLRIGSRCAACQRSHNLRRGPSGWGIQAANRVVLAAAGGRCELCGNPAREVDHVTPLALNGTDRPQNKRALCRSCHRRETLRQFRGEG